MYKVVGERLGWEYTKESAFGFYKGYPVVILNDFPPMHRMIIIDISFKDREKIVTLYQNIESKKRESKISHIVEEENGIVIFMNDFFWPVTYSKFRHVLDFTINLLNELGIEPNLCRSSHFIDKNDEASPKVLF